MKTKQFKNAPKFEQLQKLAVAIQSGNRYNAMSEVNRLLESPLFAGKAWQANLLKLKTVIQYDVAQFPIFKLDGNSKLPFVAFSSLPAVTCPGAGDCLEFCYSFRAWRFPAAFARMAQNAWLMINCQDAIREAAADIVRKLGSTTLRLYVDGDFASVEDVIFWMNTLQEFPSINAYGYSKSFAELLDYHATGREWPVNYQLNISSGHCHDAQTLADVKELPIVRGEFVAVSIGRKVKGDDHGKPETNEAIRKAFGAKLFPCPGSCGSCTSKGHACGSARFKGLTIAIAMH